MGFFRNLKSGQFAALLLFFLVLLFAAAVISISVGRFYIVPGDVVSILANLFVPLDRSWQPQAESVIYTLRLPRMLAAVMIGASLALSGACVGAAIAILLGLAQAGVQVSAFLGGVIAVSCAVMIPKIIGRNSIVMLVLAGIIIGGLMSSILGIIKYVADADTQLPAITYWQLGSLVSVEWNNIIYNGVPIVLCILFLMLIRWRMNILTLSDEETHMLGHNSGWLRYAIIFCATVLTASSVCISGTIGWVGLVIPHFSRMLVGPDNRKLLPLSVVLGALFLLVIDTISRASMDSEIPLSILTGLVGAPFYFYLLLRQRLNLS